MCKNNENKVLFISFVENIIEFYMGKNLNEIGFLFDLDGVIIDSETEYTHIWNQINEEFPSGHNNLAYIIKGCTLPKILNDYYPDPSTQKKVAERLHSLENQMKYEFLPYAFEFLENLKDKGYKCALVTSSDNEKMSHLWIQQPLLKNFFDYIVTGSQVKNSKPSPEGYLLASKKINCFPHNCIVFEDSLQGVTAGRNAGSKVVGISGTLPSEILAPYSNIVINNFNDIDIDKLILNLFYNE